MSPSQLLTSKTGGAISNPLWSLYTLQHNHRILLRDKKDSKIVKSTGQLSMTATSSGYYGYSMCLDMSEEGVKDGPVAHVPQLRVFRDVAGYCGVCLSVCVCVLCAFVCIFVCVSVSVCLCAYLSV